MTAKYPIVVAVRLTVEEAEDLDQRRGSLSRTQWLRWLQLEARKRDTRFGGLPE